MWERLAALEPADPSRGTIGAGQLEAGLSEMSAVLEQRNRLQVRLAASQTETCRHSPCQAWVPMCSGRATA